MRPVFFLSASRDCCITADKRGRLLQQEDKDHLIVVRKQMPSNASNILPDV